MAKLVLSDPEVIDLEIYRGDSGSFIVTVTDALGAPIDVSAASWLAEIRETPDSPTPITAMTVTPVAGQPSQVAVKITPGSTNPMMKDGSWDLQMTLGGEITTLMGGKVILAKDVSKV